MMKRTLLSSAIAIAGSLGMSAALAQTTEEDAWSEQSTQQDQWSEQSQQQSALPSFSELDTDGDGFLSEEELQANMELSEVHSQLDENADGLVDETEFAALEEAHMSPGGEMDKKHEGTDTYEESATDY